MTSIQHNLQQVRERITAAAEGCGRDPQQITLLAVSKTKPVSAIREAWLAGQRCFGENYVQEGVDKIALTTDLDGLEWHFIGPLQSNKSRLVAGHFDWCHTLDRQKLAQRLNDQRPPQSDPLNVLIQVNISDEASKSGISVAEIPQLARQIAALPRLKLRGLMAIPAPSDDYQSRLAVCLRMAEAFAALQSEHAGIDTLSLGMSDDMDAAIEAGSTMVRIGSAIFGARQYPPSSPQ
ncbi:YggS family pyridoxal phosphate-dependent enzyme [Tatumella sp. JGM130]|uniref:YggS family pyridoxal phosphate-dependent enzyme n=1 Tax=Tatumella sp. JGM130 TaxID=2799797 RepID=UPI001BAF3087|nr:YggS family pyridoxal phosphate-dependent enzyme [Tatumella sp. JGM130]MBS0894780.1 YggS family pyridoxal phosphate-dependent enzyme [Tatumella sp. JGM130]